MSIIKQGGIKQEYIANQDIRMKAKNGLSNAILQ